MGFLQLFILASLSWPGFSQTCPAMELSFILDLSYNARLASTNFVNFDILEDQLRKIFNDSVLYNSANISVEAFGYNDNPYEIIPYWSSLSNASSYLSILQRIRILNTSTTLNGLGKMTVGPRYNDSIIFLVTSQGSNGSLLTLTAIEYAKILKNRGWNIRVIALKSVNDFNILELQGIDANYVTVSTLPKSYLGLADAVIGIVEQRCLKYVSAAASTTTTTLSSTASLTTTTLSSTEPITTTTPSTSESSLATALPATTTISPPTPPTATTLTSQSTTTTITSTPESTTTTSTTLPVTTTTTSTPFPSLITTISTSSPPIITTISTPSPTTSITTMTPSPTTTTAPPTTTTLTPSSTTTTAPTTTTTSTQSTTTTTTTLTPELTTTTAPTTTTTSLTPESISTTSPTSTSTSAPTTTPTSTFTTTTTTLTTTKPSTTTMSSSTTTQISTIQLTTASPTNATSISTAMLTTTPTTTTTIPSTAPTTTSPPSTTTSISTTTPGTSTSLPTTTTSPTTTAPITTTSTQSSTTLLSTTTAPSSTKILSTSTALVSTTTSPTTNTTSAITTPTTAASITTPLPTTTTTSSASQSPTTTTTLSIPSTTFSTRILTTSWSPPNETQSTTSAPVGTPTSKVCGKMQLLFLLDLSQVAYMSATSRSDRTLDILENQLKLIFIYLSLYPRVQIRVEVIGYSANGSIHILPHWTAPSKASKKLWKLKQFPNTDAWSSSGFTNIHSRPKYVNNILFYVTSQTTNNDTNRDQTLEDVNRVKAMGWNVRVFALKTSSSVIDLNELADLDKSFITISDEPKCYTGLSREVTKILKSVCKEFNSETLPPCKTKGRKSRAHQD